MKSIKIFLPFFMIFLFTTPAMAKNQNVVECDIGAEICKYTTKNRLAEDIRSKIITQLFKATTLESPERIEVNTAGELTFWFSDTNLRNKVIDYIYKFDTMDHFSRIPIVVLTAEIYSMSEKTFESFDASLSYALNAAMQSLDPKFNMLTGTLMLNFRPVSDDILAGALSVARQHEEVTQMTNVTARVPNLTYLDYSNTADYAESPTAGSVTTQKSGLILVGRVSINAEDSKQIRIENFSFNFSVPRQKTKEQYVTILDTIKFGSGTNPLDLREGVSYILFGTTTQISKNAGGWGILNIKNERQESKAKIVAIIRARALTPEDESNEDQLYSQNIDKASALANTDSLPKNGISTDEVTRSMLIKPILFGNGEKALAISFDKKLATQENIGKMLKISINSKDYNMLYYRTTKDLMTKGILLQNFPLSLLKQKQVKFKIKIESQSLKKDHDKFSKTMQFFYYPETNEIQF